MSKEEEIKRRDIALLAEKAFSSTSTFRFFENGISCNSSWASKVPHPENKIPSHPQNSDKPIQVMLVLKNCSYLLE